jgi:hypothetical protein
MDTASLGVTFAAAALAYGLIRNARAYAAARRREAEFFARRLVPGRFGSGKLYGSDDLPMQAVTVVAYQRLN